MRNYTPSPVLTGRTRTVGHCRSCDSESSHDMRGPKQGRQIGRPFQCRWTDRNRSFLGRSADVCLDSRSALHYLAPQYWTFASWWVINSTAWHTDGIGNTIAGDYFYTNMNFYSESPYVYEIYMENEHSGTYTDLYANTISINTGLPCTFDQGFPSVMESGGNLGSCGELPGSPVYFDSLSMDTGPASSPGTQYNYQNFNPQKQLLIGNTSPHCGWNIFWNDTNLTAELWP
jgi:hypothetical protein